MSKKNREKGIKACIGNIIAAKDLLNYNWIKMALFTQFIIRRDQYGPYSIRGKT